MTDFFPLLFDTSDFTPRAHCGHWTNGLITLHVVADVLIWLAYLAIPFLLVIVAVRKAIPLQKVFTLVGLFVVFCGFTHLTDALMFTTPAYRAAGLLKAATAVVSWGVLIALIPLLPRALTAFDLAARKDLLDRMRMLEAAVERTNEVILVTAAGPGGPSDQRIVYANPAFERQTGYARAEAYGMPPRMLQGPDTDPAARAAVRSALANGTPVKVELLNYRRDGATFWADVSISPVEEGPNGPAHWVAVHRDVTDRRALEEQLRQAQKLEAVGQLASGIAHDFNNILTVVRGAGQLLRDSPVGTVDSHALADEVCRAADRAAGLVGQLLTFSRCHPSEPESLDLAGVASDMAGMLRRLVGDHVTLNIEPAAGPVPVVADRAKLEQVVLNLVVNARDAMPAGGRVTITAGDTVDASGRRWATLEVSDTGCGMNPSTLAHIFEPFFTTKGPGKGTGLGLATVYGIVTQAGGRIDVDSNPGSGTAFRVELPWAGAAVASTGAATDGAVPLPPEDGAGRMILLAEDEDPVRMLARVVFESAGYVVTEAADGTEALERLDHGPAPDLIVTDLTMPGANGREVAARAHTLYPGTAVLIVSGFAPDADQFDNQPGVVFLQKPYTPAELIRAAGAAIRKASEVRGDSRVIHGNGGP